MSYVKGKEINYGPEAINKLLDITPPAQCDVQRRIDECKNWKDEDWEELLLLLCVEGAKWQGGSRMLLRSDFKPYPKA